jgi:hypothetical protein
VIKFEVDGSLQDQVIDDLETELGPKRYHLHNKVGGVNWAVACSKSGRIEIQLPNQSESYMSYLLLKYNWL